MRERLGPFSNEALGGSTGVVDLGGREACGQASYPDEDPSLALSKATGATNQTTVLNDHGEHNPIPEVTYLLELVVQFLVGPEPLVKEATDRRSTLDEARAPVQDPIFGDAAWDTRRGHRDSKPQTARAQAPPSRGSWTPQPWQGVSRRGPMSDLATLRRDLRAFSAAIGHPLAGVEPKTRPSCPNVTPSSLSSSTCTFQA